MSKKCLPPAVNEVVNVLESLGFERHSDFSSQVHVAQYCKSIVIDGKEVCKLWAHVSDLPQPDLTFTVNVHDKLYKLVCDLSECCEIDDRHEEPIASVMQDSIRKFRETANIMPKTWDEWITDRSKHAKYFLIHGFSVSNTGGGCSAWEKYIDNPKDNEQYACLRITCVDDACTPDATDSEFCISLNVMDDNLEERCERYENYPLNPMSIKQVALEWSEALQESFDRNFNNGRSSVRPCFELLKATTNSFEIDDVDDCLTIRTSVLIKQLRETEDDCESMSFAEEQAHEQAIRETKQAGYDFKCCEECVPNDSFALGEFQVFIFDYCFHLESK